LVILEHFKTLTNIWQVNLPGVPAHGNHYFSPVPIAPYLTSSYLNHNLPSHPGPSQVPPPPQQPYLPHAPHSPSTESSDLLSVDELLKQVAKPAQKVAGTRLSAKSKGKAMAANEHPKATQGTKRKTVPTNST
jgi:hypothetical protein